MEVQCWRTYSAGQLAMRSRSQCRPAGERDRSKCHCRAVSPIWVGLQQRCDSASNTCAHQSAGHRSAGSLTDDSVRTAPLQSNGGCCRDALPKCGKPVPLMPCGSSSVAGRALKDSKFVSAQLVTSCTIRRKSLAQSGPHVKALGASPAMARLITVSISSIAEVK